LAKRGELELCDNGESERRMRRLGARVAAEKRNYCRSSLL
jgi:hypothetical protein